MAYIARNYINNISIAVNKLFVGKVSFSTWMDLIPLVSLITTGYGGVSVGECCSEFQGFTPGNSG